MTTENEKMLYTLQSLLHARVTAMSDMLFERLSKLTGELEHDLHLELRDRSRKQFLDTTQALLHHPDVTSPIPAVTMLETAEAMWKCEDDMLRASQTDSKLT